MTALVVGRGGVLTADENHDRTPGTHPVDNHPVIDRTPNDRGMSTRTPNDRKSARLPKGWIAS
ncbi:hypothetical protein [Streptomyces varsoviensis]|uniref:Uncharacterized protein n=1 Tax=Streptomyces varsoviensis TaxID=67373 RepID=A0ABR5J8X7_9ACTN|nr:hypothetical protein [Streptomyces varsoviensis]KOG89850.1 hypothetical protein ADK38_12000 [Streptomyces varsoviensis]